tara:strand:- start:1 stop:456 length:456 start_codon:yes stop_codon:yes gene_type:complete
MSTLKVGTIQNTSAAHSSTPEEIAQGRAKAWVNFNGTTVTSATDMTGVNDSFNVSSVVDNGVGDYTINFSSAMSNANYVFVGNVRNIAGNSPHVSGSGPINENRGPVSVFVHETTGTTTAACRINSRYGSSDSNDGSDADFTSVYCAFFGD